jgi:hypothetical protein
MASPPAPPPLAASENVAEPREILWPRVLRVAWLSILLGLAIEAVVLAIAAGYGRFQEPPVILADTLQKVSWSFLVCVGLACGTAAARAAPAMGLLGLAVAPAAFAVSRALHKSAQHALNVTSQAALGPSVWTVALLRGLEYAVLGYWIGHMAQRSQASLGRFLLAGTAVGVIFGGAILWLSVARGHAPLPVPVVIVRAANEVLFPIGCSFVLFVSSLIGSRAKG